MVTVLAAVAPPAAHAQQWRVMDDRAYCAALGARYDGYVGPSDNESARPSKPRNVDADVAKAKCQAVDTATGIPILARSLADAKVVLPGRDASGSRW